MKAVVLAAFRSHALHEANAGDQIKLMRTYAIHFLVRRRRLLMPRGYARLDNWGLPVITESTGNEDSEHGKEERGSLGKQDWEEL